MRKTRRRERQQEKVRPGRRGERRREKVIVGKRERERERERGCRLIQPSGEQVDRSEVR